MLPHIIYNLIIANIFCCNVACGWLKNCSLHFPVAGDDCISIQTGCNGVKIHNVNCGPGHGISIGGLGRDSTKACVSNITVQDVNMYGTMTGVRIKTWQVKCSITH